MKTRMLHSLAFICILIWPLSLQAKEEKIQDIIPQAGDQVLFLKNYEPTHPELILMAFNKVGNLNPDFLEWAKQSPFLKTAKDIDKDAIINREANRLTQVYQTVQPDEQLVVHAKISLDNYSTIQEFLTLNEFDSRTFFSYNIYGQNVAIVPKGMNDFHRIKFSKAEMENLLKKANTSQIEAEILLKPIYADVKAPFNRGGKDYWLLLADIGEIRFWTKKSDPELLWMHRAEWFKPKEDKLLLDLKTGGTTQ
jgi:hypothetical protein